MKKNGEATLPPTHTWWSELNNGIKGIILVMTVSIVIGICLFVLVRTSEDPMAAATLALGGTLLVVGAGFVCNTCLCLHTCMRVAQVYDLHHWEVKKAEFDANHDGFDWINLDDEDAETGEAKQPDQPPAKEQTEPDEEHELEVAIAEATERILHESAEPGPTGAEQPVTGDTRKLPQIRRLPPKVMRIFDTKAPTQELPDTKAIQAELARRASAAETPVVTATSDPETPPCTALAVIKQDAIIARTVQAVKNRELHPLIITENHDSPAKSQPSPEPEEDFEVYLERRAEELRIPVSCLRSKLMAFNCERFSQLPAYAQDDLRRLSA